MPNWTSNSAVGLRSGSCDVVVPCFAGHFWGRFSVMGRLVALPLLCFAILGLCGCNQGSGEFNQGKKAEELKDYDTALVHYDRALKSKPSEVEYQLKVDRMRFEAAQAHVNEGQKLRKQGDNQMALAEFQKAMQIDPSSPIAQQETQNTLDSIAAKAAAQQPAAKSPDQTPHMMAGPPDLQPLSNAPINYKATNDTKVIFETVAKLAGLTVIFDPDFTSRRISIELTNVTVQQALDIVSLEAKAFWKPVTNNIIFVIPDQAQKRKDYEEEIVRTIYLKNTILPQDITEIVNGLRQLLDLRRVQQFNAQNAIIVRDTPDKVLLAEKIIEDIDKPKSEVIIQFAVLQAETNRMRDLGINPGSASASLTFAPPTTTNSSSTTSTTTSAGIPLNQLKGLSTADYSLSLPSATATALLTDSTTQIIDDPQIRIVDGQDAKLSIGSRVPIATGSFQAGVGVGSTGSAGLVNPLVNTQFQYLDVGVIVDVTPRVHPEDNDVSLKLSIEVSSVTSYQSIGGINQPVIGTNKIEHNVRLKDGEVNVLGGLIKKSTQNTVSGIPGFSQIPFIKYFTADNNKQTDDSEVLIVVIPHIIRTPNITLANLRSLASGTDTNPEIRLESEVLSPASITPSAATQAPVPGVAVNNTAQQIPGQPAAQGSGQTATLGFSPATGTMKVGDTATLGIVVQNVQDLYSMPLLLQYDPKVISVEEVQQGGFLSGGTQPIAVVERVDKERGQAVVSATRMPNTPGISGSGTVFGVVIKALAPGASKISIVQTNARDSQQHPLQLVTSEANVQVSP